MASSVMVLGVAGGNGLEHINVKKYYAVYGVDVNSDKELGLTHIFLLTDNNVPAYEFYKKCGFYELKRNAAFAKEL